MFGLTVLDIAIGLIFVYLIFSLVCTAVREMLASMTNARMRNLAQGIENLLGPKTDAFYAHGLIQSLSEQGRKPSYIPQATFALATVEVLAEGNANDFAAVRTAIEALPAGRVRQALLALADAANNDIAAFRKNLEQWFEESMQRVGAWYKRRTQWVLLAIALIVATAANVDTIAISNSLSKDKAMRDGLVAQAQAYVKANPNGPPQQNVQQAVETAQKLGQIGIPIGWNAKTAGEVLGQIDMSKVIGLLLSAFAFSLGAPFWFDMLNKVMTIRSAGDAPREKQK